MQKVLAVKRRDSSDVGPMKTDCILISNSLGNENIPNRHYRSVFTPVIEEHNPSSPSLFSRILENTSCQNSRVLAHIPQFPHILQPLLGLINT